MIIITQNHSDKILLFKGEIISGKSVNQRVIALYVICGYFKMKTEQRRSHMILQIKKEE